MDVLVDSAKWLLEEAVKDLQQVKDVLCVIGVVYVGKVTLTVVCNLASVLRVHVWSKLVSRNLVREYGGKWAVVTGSSDGIGKGYAAALAKKGMNVMLISRTQEKLEKVAQDICGQYGVQTEIMQVDFALGQPIYDDIGKRLAGKDIGILVNNVGLVGSLPSFFKDLPQEDIWAILNVNSAAAASMTKLVLPGMLARKKGAIINISSVAGCMSLPLFQMYCASKAFIDHFSEALDYECRLSGITVQNITPCAVSTNMTKFDPLIHKQGFFTPSQSKFASHALSTLGYARNTTGYWTHGIQLWLTQAMPSWLMVNAHMWRYKSFTKKSN
ncbi:inactive hydroxysteroid dehydrogenase-like protein 1 [Procambarus clarkii]|uniref:inactive hydroxysteroid dehydrogenase-like protein 1 n=1 Tax=Procambarus clarkii TaxID=6728 RepID=UPI003743C258